MENLVKQAVWYNPFAAITENGKAHDLENIIIYNEKGVLLETDCGWFSCSSDNNIESLEIKPSIKKKLKIDFSKKENFIIKSDCVYDTKYILYLYYKDIDYKFTGLSLDNCFLNLHFTILNQYNFTRVIGNRTSKSQSICYSIDEDVKKLTSYNFKHHDDEFSKALKTIAKKQKEYKKQEEIEKNYTTADYQKIIYKRFEKMLENNEKSFNN